MNDFRNFYWVCLSESQIYHTKPLFSTKEQKEQMKRLGISQQERYTKEPLLKVLRLCRKIKPHYVYETFTTAKFVIIDCPELLHYQKSHNLEGRLINTRKRDKLKDVDCNLGFDLEDDEIKEIDL